MILRPYQEKSIESLRTGMKKGHVRQVLCASTGAGKSVIMLEMVKAAIEKGSRVMIICERRVLVEQFSKHLDSANIEHGVLMAQHWRFRPHAIVQVASAQTLERMDRWPRFDVIFIDELHACMRKSIIEMITAFPNVKMVGATATPFHPEISKHFSNVSNVITMKELVDDGYLVPFRVFLAHEIDTKKLKIVAGEWNQKELEKRGLKIVGDVVSDYLKISNDVFGEPKKTICFSAGVAHGADLAQKFNEAGIAAVQISYKDADEYKAEVLQDFARHDSAIKMVISSDILTRGFDNPMVEHVIVARPLRKSFSAHVQMIGRGTRPYEGKEFCVIQDHAGNYLRFREDWDILYSQGVEHLKDADSRPRKEMTKPEKEAAKCPKCLAFWPAKSDICPNCGHVRHRKNTVEAVPGKMQEIGTEGKNLKHVQEIQRNWYAMLLGYCRNHGKKPGMAYYMYKEKFKKFPGGVKPNPINPTEEVINWVRSRNIAWAKRK